MGSISAISDFGFSKSVAVQVRRPADVRSPCACESCSFWIDPAGLVRCWCCSPPPFPAMCRGRLTLVLGEGMLGLGVPTLVHRPAERPVERARPAPKQREPSILEHLPDHVGLLARFFLIHNLTPRADHSHADRRHWIDQKPKNSGDRIRTICAICGGFVGYRNAGPNDETQAMELDDDEEMPF